MDKKRHPSLCPTGEELPMACPCPKTSCQFHGCCCHCVAAHIRTGKKPPHCVAHLVASPPEVSSGKKKG